jgi:hypothetical protein
MLREGCQEHSKIAEIRKFGCYLISTVKKCEIEQGLDLCIKDIDDAYLELVKRAYMNMDCFLQEAHNIYNYFAGFRVYGGVWRVTEYKAKNPIVQVVKPEFSHFKMLDWDSLNPTRPAAAQYEVESYREFYA